MDICVYLADMNLPTMDPPFLVSVGVRMEAILTLQTSRDSRSTKEQKALSLKLS